MSHRGDEDVGAVENAGRRHSGVVGIVQTSIGGLLLLVAAGIFNSQRESTAAVSAQAIEIAKVQGSLTSLTAQMAIMQQQVSGIAQISERLARIESELQEDRRRINEIEQARKLK